MDEQAGDAAARRRRKWLLVAAAAVIVLVAAGLAAASGLIIDSDELENGSVDYECVSLCDEPEGTAGQVFIAIATPDSGYRLERWHCVYEDRAGICPGQDARDTEYSFTYDETLRTVTPVFVSADAPPGPVLTAPPGSPVAPERLEFCTAGGGSLGVSIDPALPLSADEAARRALAAAQPSLAAIQGGSGWVWSADGVLITGYHLVLGEDLEPLASLDVVLGADAGTDQEGTVYSGSFIGGSAALNLAAVRIARGGLTPLELAASSHASPGQLAVGAGFRNGGGDAPGSAHGIVSDAAAAFASPLSASGYRIQGGIESDAPAGAFIGGPLLDSGGRALGMISQHLVDSGSGGGVVRALPADLIRRFAPALAQGGAPQIPYLGLQAEAGADGAARVVSVDSGGPAQAAGVQPGDSISSVSVDAGGSTMVATGRSLDAFIGLCAAPGDEVTLQLSGGAASLTASSVPAQHAGEQFQEGFSPEPPTRLPVSSPSNGAALPLNGGAYANREALGVDLYHAARRSVVAVDNGESSSSGWAWSDELVVASAQALVCRSCRGEDTPLQVWLPDGTRRSAEVAGIFDGGLPPDSGVLLLRLAGGLEPLPRAGEGAQPAFSVGLHYGNSISMVRAEGRGASARFEGLQQVRVPVLDHLLGGQALLDAEGRAVGMLLTRSLDLQSAGGDPHAVTAAAIAAFAASLEEESMLAEQEQPVPAAETSTAGGS